MSRAIHHPLPAIQRVGLGEKATIDRLLLSHSRPSEKTEVGGGLLDQLVFGACREYVVETAVNSQIDFLVSNDISVDCYIC